MIYSVQYNNGTFSQLSLHGIKALSEDADSGSFEDPALMVSSVTQRYAALFDMVGCVGRVGVCEDGDVRATGAH
jgi:hypothetical protein